MFFQTLLVVTKTQGEVTGKMVLGIRSSFVTFTCCLQKLQYNFLFQKLYLRIISYKNTSSSRPLILENSKCVY